MTCLVAVQHQLAGNQLLCGEEAPQNFASLQVSDLSLEQQHPHAHAALHSLACQLAFLQNVQTPPRQLIWQGLLLDTFPGLH